MESRRRKLLAYSLICFSYLIILHEINAVPTLKASKSIQEELELNPKYKIAWRIDEGSDKIEFDLIVQSTGYVGFGLSPTGGMDGADMIIAGVLDNGTVYFSDRHGVGKNVAPAIDAVENWELVSCTEADNVTSITVSRLLNTCDDEDIPITMDTAKLIYSYGDSDNMIHHGQNNRGSRSINLLYPPKKSDLSGFQNWTITVNTKVPVQDTTYWCTFHKSPTTFNGSKIYIVGWDSMLLEGEARKYTHHIDIKKCRAPPNSSYYETFDRFVGLEGTSCYDDPGEYPIHYCETYVLTWAVGRGLTLLPNDVGYATSEGDDDVYYVMEVHYDNPMEDNVEPFATGLNIYYTAEERKNKADLLGVGHYTTWSLIVPPNVTSYTVAGHCSPQCTSYFPEEGITVFSGLMHSHLSGRKLKLRHFRDGKELPWISVDNNFDFNFQENKNINNIVIMPGDQITYECVYDSTWKNGSAVVAGLSSRDEMCISWFWYYPKIDMNYCYSFYPYENVENELGIESYTWGGGPFDPPPIITAPEDMAGKTYQEVLDKVIDWNPQKIEKLENDHRFGDHYSFCFNGKTSDTYPIEDPIIKYVPVEEEYQPEEVCNSPSSSNRNFVNFLIILLVNTALGIYRCILFY